MTHTKNITVENILEVIAERELQAAEAFLPRPLGFLILDRISYLMLEEALGLANFLDDSYINFEDRLKEYNGLEIVYNDKEDGNIRFAPADSY